MLLQVQPHCKKMFLKPLDPEFLTRRLYAESVLTKRIKESIRDGTRRYQPQSHHQSEHPYGFRWPFCHITKRG